jgi:hypothetical protein
MAQSLVTLPNGAAAQTATLTGQPPATRPSGSQSMTTGSHGIFRPGDDLGKPAEGWIAGVRPGAGDHSAVIR